MTMARCPIIGDQSSFSASERTIRNPIRPTDRPMAPTVRAVRSGRAVRCLRATVASVTGRLYDRPLRRVLSSGLAQKLDDGAPREVESGDEARHEGDPDGET